MDSTLRVGAFDTTPRFSPTGTATDLRQPIYRRAQNTQATKLRAGPERPKRFPHRRANRNPSKLEYRQPDHLSTNRRRSAIITWRSCGGRHCRWCHHCRRHNPRDALLPELILSKLIWRVVGTQHKTLTGRYRLIDSRSNRSVGCRWIIGSLAASLGRTGLLWRATATVIGNPSRLHTSVVGNPRCIEHTPDQIVVGFSLPNT